MHFDLCNNTKAEAATIKLNKTKLTLDLGMSYTLKAPGTSNSIKWTSGNTKIVKVTSKGKITALAEGTATITASVGSKKLSCKVSVTDKISDNWKDFVVLINNEVFKLPIDYKQLQDAGWDFDLSEYGYDKYLMEPGDVFGSVFKLEHPDYDSEIYIGFINTDNKKNSIKKCKVNSISISNKYAKHPAPIILPGGIKNGSSALDVLNAYDDPDNSDKSGYGYWVYQYYADGTEGVTSYELLIDDKIGVFDVVYKSFYH
jgi:hypothetical protein